MASQITHNWTIYSEACLNGELRNITDPHCRPFVRGIHWWPVNSQRTSNTESMSMLWSWRNHPLGSTRVTIKWTIVLLCFVSYFITSSAHQIFLLIYQFWVGMLLGSRWRQSFMRGIHWTPALQETSNEDSVSMSWPQHLQLCNVLSFLDNIKLDWDWEFTKT